MLDATESLANSNNDDNDNENGREFIALIADPSEKVTMSVDEAIERLGMGKFQWRIFMTVGLCSSADAIQVLILSYLSVVLKSEWDLSSAQASLITSSVFVGAMFGSVLFGPLADRIGRRPTLLLAAIMIALFGVLTSTTSSYVVLLSLLSMVGVGVGGLTVPYDTLAEYLPNSYRGASLLAVNYFWTFGSMLALLAAYVSLQRFHSWRFMIVATSIPCWISAIVGWFAVPETPRWLVANQKSSQALQTLRQAAKTNGLDEMAVFPPGTELLVEEEEQASFQDLLLPKWRWIILNLAGVWASFGLLYYGTILSITVVFQKEDSNTGKLDFDYMAMLTSASAELFGVTAVILTVDRWGRIPSQAWPYLVGGFCAGAMCIGSTTITMTDKHTWLLAALAFGARLCLMGASCVTWIITPELLTTEVRATGHGVVNAMARITGSLSPFVVQGGSSRLVTGLILVAFSILATVCVCQLPETAGKAMGGVAEEEYQQVNDNDNGEDRLDRIEETEC